MNVKYSCFLLSFIILSSDFVAAQSKLKGIVTGEKHNPVPYATVSLDQQDGVSSVTQADSAGHFIFKKLQLGNYNLSVYTIGYQKRILTLHISDDTTIRILLKPLNESLKEVTITGSKPVIERKADRIIYNVANSVSAAGSDGLEALGKAPGTMINNNNISIAGKGSVNIMINNRMIHLSGEALTRYLKSISANQISKIEIITHPSARYDAEGNAGLINIITKHAEKPGFSGDIEGSALRFLFTNPPYYGVRNYGYINGGANLNYTNDRLTAYGNIGYTHGRELEGYGIDVFYPKQHWSMKDTGDYKHFGYNFLAGADYKVSPRTTIGFEYMFEKGVYDGADHVHDPIYNSLGGIDSTLRTYADYYPIDNSNSFNLHLLQNPGSSSRTLTLDADYFNYYRNDRSDFETNTYMGDGKLNPGSRTRYHDTTLQNIRIYTLKADLTLPTPFAEFMVGSKISFIDNYSNIYYYDKINDSLKLNYSLSNEYRYIENTQALYAEGTKTIEKWKMQAGLRAEITQTTGISYFLNQEMRNDYLKLFPSLLVSYDANEENSFLLTYNKRIHRPTFWELNPYKSLMTAYTYVEGNPYLQPEYINDIELSHTYKSILTSSLYLNIIHNGYVNVTRGNADSNYIHTKPLNFISTQRYGISESLSVNPFRWMESNNQVNAYYTMAQSHLPYINGIQGFGLYVATNNTFSFNENKTISGIVNFWCQFPEVDHFGRSNTYYKLDLGLQALTMQKKLSLSLNATDLLQSSVSTIYSTVNNLREIYTNFQVFSNIKFSATWNFGNSHTERKHVKTGNEAERDRVN